LPTVLGRDAEVVVWPRAKTATLNKAKTPTIFKFINDSDHAR
jgi:hypothetical protein